MKRFLEADQGGGTGGAGGGTTILGGSAQSSQQPPSSTPAAPSSWNWASEDGKFSEGWIDKLPEDLRNEASLRVIQDLPTLAKSYVHTKKAIGSKLEMPSHDAPPEAIANWRKVTGAPETPEGYLGDAKTLKPDDFPAEYWDAEGEKGFLALAHKHSLPPAVVNDLVAFDAARLKGGLEKNQAAFAAEQKKDIDALKTEWGADFEKNEALFARAATTLGLPFDRLPKPSEFAKAMLQFTKLVSEDKIVAGEKAGNFGASLAEQIADITNPGSGSHLARAYRGELTPQAQQEAQQTLHRLYAAQQQR